MSILAVKEIFILRRNECQENVYECRICGLQFVEHDGDMITQQELANHLTEEHEK